MNCQFCYTGRLGLMANLQAAQVGFESRGDIVAAVDALGMMLRPARWFALPSTVAAPLKLLVLLRYVRILNFIW